jgi:hypothetical protein
MEFKKNIWFYNPNKNLKHHIWIFWNRYLKLMLIPFYILKLKCIKHFNCKICVVAYIDAIFYKCFWLVVICFVITFLVIIWGGG